MAADGVVGGGLVKRLTDTVTVVGDGKAVAGAAAANADDADDGKKVKWCMPMVMMTVMMVRMMVIEANKRISYS